MKVNPNIFRGYDIRGIAGKDLTSEIVHHIGKAFGTYLRRRSITQVVVGRDSRKTSPEYSRVLVEGMRWAGIDVVDIGMQLVGTFYWSQHRLQRRGGVYITASHNPPQFNGMKLAHDFSETLVSDGIQTLREMVQKEDYQQAGVLGQYQAADVVEDYFQDIISRVPLTKKFRVVVDASFATAGAFAPTLLRLAGCEVIESHCSIDPSFPLGTADPTEQEVAKRLAEKVVQEKADVGFSYDTDGDRIGIVDERGNIIWNDVLVALFARDVLRDHPGAIIMYNTLCSKVVEETIRQYGGRPFMWRTGHSFLKKKNQEIQAAFIGELSGHFFFSKDFYNHDDGLYSTLRLLRYLSREGVSLSQAVSSLPFYISSPEIKIFCDDDKKVSVVERLATILRRQFPTGEVIDDERAGDGVRLDFPDAMFVVRYSQNGPYLTIKFEAKEKEKYDSLKKTLSELLHQFSEIQWQSEINVNIEELEG